MWEINGGGPSNRSAVGARESNKWSIIMDAGVKLNALVFDYFMQEMEDNSGTSI